MSSGRSIFPALPRRAWLAVGLSALLVFVPAAALPSTQSIKGVVETADGKPVPHVEVRITNAGGTISSDSGEFAIALPSQYEPGDPIIVRVNDWIVFDPFVGTGGKTYIPKSTVEPMIIRVARKGDQSLLSNQQLIQKIVQAVTSQISRNRPRHRSPIIFWLTRPGS